MTPTVSDPHAVRPRPQAWSAAHWVAALGEPTTADACARPPLTGDASKRGLRLLGNASPRLRAGGEHESCVVVFDGILYDRPSLDPSAADATERALTDAEVVVRAYRRWGEDVLGRLAGIFALIIWDADRDLLLAARDPVGMHPLYWATAGRELLVSPSSKALVRAPGVSAAIHRAALVDHLCRRWPSVDETFFLSVHRVPPGHVLRVHRGQPRLSRYWDPAPPGRAVEWVREDELERFEDLFTQAVERCARFGPPGVYLSGGLDSVSVAAVAVDLGRRGSDAAPWALSLLFPGSEIDETRMQRDVAAALGMPQLLVPFDEAAGPRGVLAAALDMSRRWPWPLLNPWNPAYQHLGARGIERGCQVILSGHGGDEWLTVSPAYAADLLRAVDLRGLGRQIAVTAQSYQISWIRTLRLLLWHYGARPVLGELAATVLGRVAPDLVRTHRRRSLEDLTPGWIAPDPALRRELDWRVEQRVEAGLREPAGGEWYLREIRRALEWVLQALEFEEWFENGRRLGVRVLAPFWDADLVRFLYRVPPRLLNWNGWSKGLVRRTLARRFPGLGFERQPKVAVRTYHRDLLLRDGPGAWRALGGVPVLAKLGIVDATALGALMAEIFVGVRPEEWVRIWPILSFEAWLRGRLHTYPEEDHGV